MGILKKNSVASNLVYSIAANLISLLVSTILLLLLPNLLGETEYGYWQLYLFYTSYVGFFHFGIVDGIYLRIGGEEFKNLDKKLYASQFWILTLFEIVIAGIIASVSVVMIQNVDKMHAIILTCICMVVYIANNYIAYVLQATNRIQEYAMIVMTEKIAFAVLVGVCWILHCGSFEIIAVGDIGGKVLAWVISLKYCRELIFNRMNDLKITLSELVTNLSVGCKLVLANVASMLITGIVRLAIEDHWSIEVFGKISLAMSISNMLMVFINAVSVVVFPMLKRMDDDKLGETYEKIRNFLMIILLGALVFYYPLKVILTYILPAYAESMKYMALMFPVCVFDCKIALLINTYLKALRKEKEILFINVFSVLLTVLTTFITVYIMGSLEFAVLSIVLVLAIKGDIAEVYISKSLGIHVFKDICIESVLVCLFIITSWFLDNILSTVVYLGGFIIYCLIKRRKVFELLSDLKK